MLHRSIRKSWLILGLGVLAFGACGKPTVDMVFNTSTEVYPVVNDSESAALEGIGGSASGLPVTSVVRIQMQPIQDGGMQSIWLQALALVAKEGALSFVQSARCYVQPRGASDKQPILIGKAKADDVGADGKSLKFQVDSGVDLAGTVRSPFNIVIEIEGDQPASKVTVLGEVTFKARISL